MLENLLYKRSRINDGIALKYKDREITYSQLDVLSSGISRKLKNLLKRGDYIITFINNPIDYCVFFFGCLKSETVMIPLNPQIERETYSNIKNVTRCKLVIDDFNDYGITFNNFSGNLDMHLNEMESNIHNPYNLDRQVLILLTGGTTGTPKGAIIPERSILWNSFNTILSWKISAGSTSLVSLPLYHTGGWNILLIPTLVAGGKCIFSGYPFNEDEIIECIKEEKPTIYMGVPTMLEKISLSKNFEMLDLRNITIVSGGGMLKSKTAEKFRGKGACIFQGYGLTEAGPNNFYIDPLKFIEKPRSVGTPCLFVDAKLGDDNELLLRGPHIFNGYLWGNDESPIDNNGFLKTGDIFTRDDDGYYYFSGRKKEVIKSGGENIYISEVENALLSLGYISDTSIIGLPDDFWGEIEVAFVVTSKSVAVDIIKKDLLKLLAPYKIPKKIIFMEKIPRSQLGKPLKKEMVKEYEKSLH